VLNLSRFSHIPHAVQMSNHRNALRLRPAANQDAGCDWRELPNQWRELSSPGRGLIRYWIHAVMTPAHIKTRDPFPVIFPAGCPRGLPVFLSAFRYSSQLMRLASKAVSSSGHLFPVVCNMLIARKYRAMCPTDAEFSTFSIRRTLYFKSREEYSRNSPQCKIKTEERQQQPPPGPSPGTFASIVNPDESASSTSPG
jgi:hypothetical protein